MENMYIIESPETIAEGRIELFTWHDACDIVKDQKEPGKQLIIRQFYREEKRDETIG
jgi:hypothetical protein